MYSKNCFIISDVKIIAGDKEDIVRKDGTRQDGDAAQIEVR